MLTGSKYLWLYAEDHLSPTHTLAFAPLKALNLKVGRARAIKEALRTLWTYRQLAAARRFFRHWYGWARRVQLAPIRRVAATLERHLDGVLRYCQHPITNGVAEGLNSKIMTIKRKACGFATKITFRRRSAFIAVGSIYTHVKAGSAVRNSERQGSDQPELPAMSWACYLGLIVRLTTLSAHGQGRFTHSR